MKNFIKIQNKMEELADLLLEWDKTVDEYMDSYGYYYTMRDYANLSIILMTVLSPEYTRKLADITSSTWDDPNRYAGSQDIIERVAALNAPFTYHLWMNTNEIISQWYFKWN